MLRSILHCDMNNFYASVECMLDPALRKYPIAVCGSVEERHGIVLAKNYKATLNKAIRRIIRDCNDEQLLKDENAEVLLPHFSCHSLRHTFTTRMCEAGVNVKVIQDTLGHKDISTTLNIYTDVTKELRKSEFEGLDSYFKNEYNKVSV